MKVLHINTLAAPYLVGGAERTVGNLSSGLRRRGHDVNVLALKPKAEHFPESELAEDSKTNYVALQNVYWPFDNAQHSKFSKAVWHGLDVRNFFMMKVVREKLKEIQPDVVVTHNIQGWSSGIWGVVSQFGIPLIHSLHDQSLLCPTTVMYKNDRPCATQCLDCKILSLPKKIASQHITTVVSVSHALLRRHQSYGWFASPLPTQVIHNAWRGAFPETLSPHPCRQSQGKKWSIGYMGRIESEKGITTFIEACQRLQNAGHEIKMVVAGQGKSEYIDNLCMRYDVEKSIFVGAKTPETFYPEIDFLVVPSQVFEGLGNVAFEAMVFGRPSVVSDQGGLPEIVTDGSGEIFQAGNVDDLVAKLTLVIRDFDSFLQRTEAACKRARYFHTDRQLDQYEALLKSIVKK